MNIDFYRHGDVMILTRKGFSIEKAIKLKPGKLIHQGANNSHVVKSGQALFGETATEKFMRVKKTATISHVGGSASHGDGTLPPGDYWIQIQTYFDHMSEEAKQVVD